MIININEVIFKINLNNSSYLAKEFAKYESKNSLYNHLLTVVIKQEIKGFNDFNKVSPFVIKENNIVNKYYFNKKGVFAKVSHDDLYKESLITLNKSLVKDLSELEYIILGIVVMEIMMNYHYLPFHASALKLNNKVFLLSAPSGTGKSTLRRHLSAFNSDIEVINDDKPFLEFKKDDILVFGSPFSGEEKINSNIKEKLEMIFFITQGNKNEVLEISKDEIITKLLKNIYKPKDDSLWQIVLKQIETIASKIKIKKVSVINDISAANFIITEMEKA